MKGLLNTPIGLLHRTKSLTYPKRLNGSCTRYDVNDRSH